MPRMGGHDLLRTLKDQLSDITFILLTAQGTIESAVDAIKDGAYDYLSKPVDPQRLRILLNKAVERQETLREVKLLRRQLREQGSFGRIVGNSPGIRSLYRVIEQAAPTSASVLVWGESGTGKELVAQTVHELSPAHVVSVRGDQLRRDSRDAARERDLRAREGGVHRRARSPDRRLRAGAPRHAVPRRDCRDGAGDAGEAAARAAGAEVPPAGRPAGADRRRPRDRRDEPRSRRRPSATASCARTSTIGSTCSRSSCRRCGIAAPTSRSSCRRSSTSSTRATTRRCGRWTRKRCICSSATGWPGNIRELRNVIERATILAEGDFIEAKHLPPPVVTRSEQTLPTVTLSPGTTVDEAERRLIVLTLEHTRNNKTRAAEILGISLKTLHNKLNRMKQETK